MHCEPLRRTQRSSNSTKASREAIEAEIMTGGSACARLFPYRWNALELREAATHSNDADSTWRMLALALVLEGYKQQQYQRADGGVDNRPQ